MARAICRCGAAAPGRRADVVAARAALDARTPTAGAAAAAAAGGAEAPRGNDPRRAAQPDVGHRRHGGLHCPGWAGGDLRHDRSLLGLPPGHPCRQARHAVRGARASAPGRARAASRLRRRHCPGREAPSRPWLAVHERRLSARDPLSWPGVLASFRARAGRQRLHRTFLPQPKGAASRSGTSKRWRNSPRRSKTSASAPTSTGRSNGYASNLRGRPIRLCLPWRLPQDDNSKNCPRNRGRYTLHFSRQNSKLDAGRESRGKCPADLVAQIRAPPAGLWTGIRAVVRFPDVQRPAPSIHSAHLWL